MHRPPGGALELEIEFGEVLHVLEMQRLACVKHVLLEEINVERNEAWLRASSRENCAFSPADQVILSKHWFPKRWE